MSKLHPLKVHKIIRETKDAVSLHFLVPENLQSEFKYNAGQYLTLETEIQGAKIRRAYSLCSAPFEETLSVVVKEVKNGRFSKFANRELREGDMLSVLPPEGKFILEPNKNSQNTYAAFAAGSGITPVISIIKTVMEEEPESKFLLVYGNKSPEDTIFMKSLMDLQQKFSQRFMLEFVFSRKELEGYQFGRISRSIANYFLKNKYKAHTFNSYFLCGPEPMIEELRETLSSNGISKEKIQFELFSSSSVPEQTLEVSEGNTALSVMLDDEETEFIMPQNKTVLEVVLEQNLDAPYSCQGGICSTCIARITEGAATMRKNQILTDDEIAEGLVLTCQAQPTTSVLKVDYDDV
ncbi:ferredoxin--NADP reductase [Planktosalinus lacus]|uniref:Flavodoxin reductase n=1 Tax=Planktosalinus lacus TaxID=1526573 RepID=A0A8J2Y7V6_9FLAO|nr:ferredoxin--NADP reductase [Planktosalinus lacus]GGD79952.1 flavodoxin reductase [Planktosalinus lacus]